MYRESRIHDLTWLHQEIPRPMKKHTIIRHLYNVGFAQTPIIKNFQPTKELSRLILCNIGRSAPQIDTTFLTRRGGGGGGSSATRDILANISHLTEFFARYFAIIVGVKFYEHFPQVGRFLHDVILNRENNMKHSTDNVIGQN